MKKSIIKFINSRFNSYYTPNGRDDIEFTNTLKGYLEGYFGTKLEVHIKSESIQIDLCRYLRECLEIEIGVTDIYVSNPTVIKINKELKDYTLIVKIRGLDHHKMLELARLANELIEPQDSINYGEEE